MEEGAVKKDPLLSEIPQVLVWRRKWQPTPVLLPGKSHGRSSLVGSSPWGREESTRLSDFTFTFHFHALEKEMATHSSVLAWRIPGTGEPGGLPSMGLHRVGHGWSDLAAAAANPCLLHFTLPPRCASQSCCCSTVTASSLKDVILQGPWPSSTPVLLALSGKAQLPLNFNS